MLQGPEGPGGGGWGWGACWAVSPSPAQAGVLGCPQYSHAARPAPQQSPAWSKPRYGRSGTGTASGRGTDPLPKPARCLQPAQPPLFPPTHSPPAISPPPNNRLEIPLLLRSATASPCSQAGPGCRRRDRDAPGRVHARTSHGWRGWWHARRCKRALSRQHGLLKTLTG